MSEEALKVSPNPANHLANINFDLKPNRMQLFDAMGREVSLAYDELSLNRLEIPICNLEKGAYFL